ncbi:DUF1800 domain-containing protein [Ferruginibacter sp. SUN002]|uniref:DUF1800 domain-containing protein n=1 Tax=Ferruginibacter sp. SUN002 TaxID=2937789 RepID=UPI003D35EDDE
MDRRAFLTASKENSNKTSVQSSRTLSGIIPYTGTWTTNEIIHLLKRTMFGAKKADVDFFSSMTMDQAVDYLLNVTPAQTSPLPPIKNYSPTEDLAVAVGETWVYTNPTENGVMGERRASLKSWWIGQMVNQERNILEKLTLMWHNHFVIEMEMVGNAIYDYQYNVTLRKNALGNLKQFVKEITLNTGMLRYLNNYLNTKTAPDENYARELQELFTVGKGADNASPPYTEDDVKQAAKVLTGWIIDGANNVSLFKSTRHDTTNKQFSAFYNNTVITGRLLDDGALEVDDLLTMIFSKEDVSLNICRKIYRWFVYYEIDAAIEQNVIAPLAQIFRDNNYDIKPVLAALFKSEHFFDLVNRGCLIKNPTDVVVGLCREFNVVFPDAANYVSNYDMWNWLNSNCTSMQQQLGDPPNVAGWPAYYQAPQYHQIWINSDTLPKRNIFSDLMVTTGYKKNGITIVIDLTAFAATMSDPGNPNTLVDDVVSYLLRIPLTQQSKDQLKTDILLDGQANDNYWTSAWNTFVSTPSNTTNTNIVKTKLKNLYQYIMRLPEYQLS